MLDKLSRMKDTFFFWLGISIMVTCGSFCAYVVTLILQALQKYIGS